MDHFVIDRRRWLRGIEETSLWDEERKAGCCLGLYLEHLGVRHEELEGRDVVPEVDWLPPEAEWLVCRAECCVDAGATGTGSGYLATRLYELNDDVIGEGEIEDENERESAIAEVFSRRGVKVEFVDE